MPKVNEDYYLGDGLYARLDPSRQIEIYSSNGMSKTNVVYMEPEVLRAFLVWLSIPDAQAK